MGVKKALSDASKIVIKDGIKDTTIKVIPLVASGVATIAIGLINKD
ncbi:hypothetical protein [Staphylococcus xylosus]|nr:hypothetical protein [Staphylococcus xylosus]MCE7786055.1 hypothetical protein [Staphylococcus xylosus]